ncbi:MAG: hypothetical protein DRH08_12410 [Deltaproteobacteria bacterium]|nr:MAG: hypothetical protein DRH08_12410 [Deltaproteobacteria bacterium]
MRVDVFNRGHAESAPPAPNTAVISISNPGLPATLKDGWEAVLRLEFHDVVRIPVGMPECEPFHDGHVVEIHDFVEENLDKDFLVHCDAGMSRSVAVGVFLQDVHGYTLHLHDAPDDSAANSRVKRGLVRKFWSKQFASS